MSDSIRKIIIEATVEGTAKKNLEEIAQASVKYGASAEEQRKVMASLDRQAKEHNVSLAKVKEAYLGLIDQTEDATEATKHLDIVFRHQLATGANKAMDAAREIGDVLGGGTGALRNYDAEARRVADAIDDIGDPARRAELAMKALEAAIRRKNSTLGRAKNRVAELNAKLEMMGPVGHMAKGAIMGVGGAAVGATAAVAAFTIEGIGKNIEKSKVATKQMEKLKEAYERLQMETGEAAVAQGTMTEALDVNTVRIDRLAKKLSEWNEEQEKVNTAGKETERWFPTLEDNIDRLNIPIAAHIVALKNVALGYDSVGSGAVDLAETSLVPLSFAWGVGTGAIEEGISALDGWLGVADQVATIQEGRARDALRAWGAEVLDQAANVDMLTDSLRDAADWMLRVSQGAASDADAMAAGEKAMMEDTKRRRRASKRSGSGGGGRRKQQGPTGLEEVEFGGPGMDALNEVFDSTRADADGHHFGLEGLEILKEIDLETRAEEAEELSNQIESAIGKAISMLPEANEEAEEHEAAVAALAEAYTDLSEGAINDVASGMHDMIAALAHGDMAMKDLSATSKKMGADILMGAGKDLAMFAIKSSGVFEALGTAYTALGASPWTLAVAAPILYGAGIGLAKWAGTGGDGGSGKGRAGAAASADSAAGQAIQELARDIWEQDQRASSEPVPVILADRMIGVITDAANKGIQNGTIDVTAGLPPGGAGLLTF